MYSIIMLFYILWTLSTRVAVSASTAHPKRSSSTLSSGYTVLGEALQSQFFPTISPSKLSSILQSLAGAQTAFKRLDGISHELYQRTHSSSYDAHSTTLGRASRSASRTGSCADALFGCELCSWVNDYIAVMETDVKSDDEVGWNSSIGTLQQDGGRQILFTTTFNYTISWRDTSPSDLGKRKRTRHLNIPISVVVLYEPCYSGGCGLDHGGIDALLLQPEQDMAPTDKRTSKNMKKGRILVIIQDGFDSDLEKTLQVLNVEPEFIDLDVGLISNELACVNGHLWRCAALVLSKIGPCIQTVAQTLTESENESNSTLQSRAPTAPFAVHFVGRSMAGAIATLSAVMMDGCIPMPPLSAGPRQRPNKNTKGKIRKRKVPASSPTESNEESIELNKEETTTMHAYGQGCTSATTLGSPPCLSPNVKAAFVTSIIYGDDIISRCTSASLNRLKHRIDKCLNGGFLAEKVGWVSDTFSLTVSNLMAHAHGSEGEEARLSIPGKVFLIRPRRLGGASSIHEIRGSGSGGREALRAAILWQLNDVLLSKSLWTHHSLVSYIRGLDKVELREFQMTDDDNFEEDDHEFD